MVRSCWLMALWLSTTTVCTMVEVGGTIEVTEPGPMAVRVEFFERGGGAGLIVRWEGPGVAKAVVPSSAWRPAG